MTSSRDEEAKIFVRTSKNYAYILYNKVYLSQMNTLLKGKTALITGTI